jgi:hypothetical protein
MENETKRDGKPKKTYRTPQLSSYGDVTQITRGSNQVGSDSGGGTGHSSKNCWIAEALYGVDAPRTLLVRAWLTRCYNRQRTWALVVVPLYRRFGRGVAAGVRSHRILQRLFRPLFDRAVVRAHRDYASVIARCTACSRR